MEFTVAQYFLIFFAGIITGTINTLAASGSFLTLPLLIFLGLSPVIANATNRVGVTAQSIVGAWWFIKSAKTDVKDSFWITVAAIIGSVCGALIAVEINEKAMQRAIVVLMIIMLVITLLNPKKWYRENTGLNKRQTPLMIVLFFLIGIYGGFIQAGVGIFILSAMIFLGNYNYKHANTVKLIIMLLFTLPALSIFIYKGLVHWQAGLILAAGQGIGAIIGALFAFRVPRANYWVHKLVILMLIIIIVSFLRYL